VTLPALTEPLELAARVIDAVIRGKTAGAYVIGSRKADHVMLVPYVGRADEDLGARLKIHIGNYEAFSYVLADSPKQAYELQCEIYHELKPSKNGGHPHKPDGIDCACPVCGT